MRQAIAAVLEGSGTSAELEAAAEQLVSELRVANDSPEQTLLRIKELLAEAGLRPSYATDSTKPLGAAAEVYRDVITWSIRHYYDNGRGGATPS